MSDCSFTFVQNRSSGTPLGKSLTRSSFHRDNAAAVLKIYLKSLCNKSFSRNLLKYFKTIVQISIGSLFVGVSNQQLGIIWRTQSTTVVEMLQSFQSKIVISVETEQCRITYRLSFLNFTFFLFLIQLNLDKAVLKTSAAETNFSSNRKLSVTLFKMAYLIFLF